MGVRLSNPREHEAFSKLTDALGEAADAARTFSQLRSDRRWQKIGQLLDDMKQKCYDLEQASQAAGLPPLEGK